MKTKNNITEKKLTKAELEAREKVMKDLKKNKSALVKRYGKDAEAVMYGRATNIAKKMAESENKNRIKELVRKSLMQEADIEVGADKYEEEEKLTQASSMLDDLETKLSRHDWFYMMSDDSNKYSQGSAKEREIRDLISKLESMGYGKEAKDMYNEKEPYSKAFNNDAKLKEAKGKDMDKDGDIDSEDYLAARDAAIKKAKGEVDEADMSYVKQQRDKLKKATDAFEKKKSLRTLQQKREQDKIEPLMREDIDLGHEDNEPHMIKAELYRIGKYAMELYQIVDGFEGKGEVDFPGWWQSKITTAMNNMVSAKHYLDFEIKEPAIDAAVDALTGEEPHEGEPMMEDQKTLNQVRSELLGLFQPYGDFKILDMTMKGQNTGTEFRMYANSKGANWKGLENFMRNNPDFTIKHISKQTFDNPKAIDFSYKKSPMMEGEIDKADILSGELYKLKGKIQDAFFDKIRKFINMGSYEDAEYLLNRIKGQMKEKGLAEIIAKKLKSK